MKQGIKLSLFLSLICLSTACGKKQASPYFHTYTQSDPGRLDPFYSTDVVSGRILSKISSGLFKIDRDGKLKPDLLKSYTFNGKTLNCELKSNLKFSNGKSLTANDVKFSFLRIGQSKNPTSPRKWIFSTIKSFKIKSDLKFTITLKKFNATYLYLLTLPTGYIISRDHFNNEKNSHNKILTCGPFLLSTWKGDEYIKLDKNPFYHGKKPLIKGIVYKIIPEDLTARFEFINQRLDYFLIPYLSVNEIKGENISVRQVPELTVHYIAINNKKYPFNKPEVRRALNMAIDRKQIMKTLFKTRFSLAGGPIPPGLGDYKSRVTPYKYDKQQAISIFKKYGLLDKTITLNIKSDQQVSLIAQLIQYYLNDCGVNLEIQEMEWAALKATTIKGKYNMTMFTWHADYPEPENFLVPLFHSDNHGTGGNRSFYSNPEADRLMDLARREINSGKRFDIYHRLEKLLVKDAPWIFLWYGDVKVALSSRVKEYVPYPTYNGMQGNDIILNH